MVAKLKTDLYKGLKALWIAKRLRTNSDNFIELTGIETKTHFKTKLENALIPRTMEVC